MMTVTLTTFAKYIEAHMLKDLLKNEGIESMLQDETTNQVLSPILNIGIQVLVFDKDLPKAQHIL